MKKSAVLGTGVCIVLASSSCESSEGAYKKAYEKAKQQELAEPQTTTPVEEVAPVVSAPVEAKVVESAPVGTIREERVTVMSGADGLKDYSVVCGSFGVEANVENLKNFLDKKDYNAVIVLSADAAMYHAIASTYVDRDSVASARDAFKAKYLNCRDFQGAWLLYRIN